MCVCRHARYVAAKSEVAELATLKARVLVPSHRSPRRVEYDEYKRAIKQARRARAEGRRAKEKVAALEAKALGAAAGKGKGKAAKLPPLTAEAKKRERDRKKLRDVFDDFDMDEVCHDTWWWGSPSHD